ncbi:Uncharacterized protein Y057_10352 [Fusarium fujikuroi]|nr:Uncharacterized protein Y057_10352 [Fusarium fujikuroi]
MRALFLAIQDPPNRLAFHNISGYNIFYSSDNPNTEEQYPSWGNRVSATATNIATSPSDGTQGATNPPTATEPPAIERLMHSNCFYVHKSIPTTSWQAIMHTGDNNGLVATLHILTASRILTIHNVYDRNNPLNLRALFESLDDTDGSADESIRSSTIDLTFTSEEIVPDVVYCRVHPAPGFRSDHRIIETKIIRFIGIKVRTKPCLDRVDEKTLTNELVNHLPPKSDSLSTREQIVSYISKLIQALRETIRLVAPRIEIGFQRKRQTILEKQLNDRMSQVTSLQESPVITLAMQERIKQL